MTTRSLLASISPASILLASIVLEGGCGYDAPIGSDARITGDALDIDVLDPCTEGCDGPGVLRWRAIVPLEQPAVLAHSSGEIVLVGGPAERSGEIGDETLRLLRIADDGAAISLVDLGIRSGMELELAETADGDLALAVGLPVGRVVVVALDGTVRWSHSLGSGNEVTDVTVDDEGSVYAGGALATADYGSEPWLGKFDDDGTLQWSRTAWPSSLVPSTGFGPVVTVKAIARDTDGHLVATGQGTASPSPVWLGKFDEGTGDEHWSYDLDRGPYDVAVSGPGRVLVSGYRRAMELEPGVGPRWQVDDVSFHRLLPSASGSIAAASYDVRNDQSDRLSFHGLDPSDGAILWTHTVAGQHDHSVLRSSLDAADDRMVAVAGEYVHAAQLMVFTLD